MSIQTSIFEINAEWDFDGEFSENVNFEISVIYENSTISKITTAKNLTFTDLQADTVYILQIKVQENSGETPILNFNEILETVRTHAAMEDLKILTEEIRSTSAKFRKFLKIIFFWINNCSFSINNFKKILSWNTIENESGEIPSRQRLEIFDSKNFLQAVCLTSPCKFKNLESNAEFLVKLEVFFQGSDVPIGKNMTFRSGAIISVFVFRYFSTSKIELPWKAHSKLDRLFNMVL